ncbi:MAG: flagellar hook-associated protein FlgK [Salinibacterium sp.]|nr:flagellar hook-associated protein FlgK [Salinibacterium sp.]
MSTFGGLSAAYTGLAAARAGIDAVGQNIANVNTEGYTRQRVSQSANGSLAGIGPLDTLFRGGTGVTVDMIQRLGNALLESRVRTASASSGYAEMNSTVMNSLESSLHEPSDVGLAATLHDFWASWQDLANHAGESSSAGVLIEAGRKLAGAVAQGYADAADTFDTTRSQAQGMVTQVNAMATQVAALNDQIRQATAAGQSPNEMLDQRARLTTSLANLTGATVVDRADGSADVLVGGNPLVTGSKTHTLVLTGAMRLEDANSSTVQLEWANRPGDSAALSGGALAAAVAAMGPGTAGSGGSIVSAAESYNALATQIATQVNAIHSTGVTTTGTTNLNFFSFAAGKPAALGLTIVPTDASGIATGAVGAGPLDGSLADKIAGLGTSTTGPDSAWSAFVVRVGIETGKASDQASTASQASASATSKLLSETSVDMDEETTQLITYQHAYQGAARVMTAIDEMLDTLINRTGLVGR